MGYKTYAHFVTSNCSFIVFDMKILSFIKYCLRYQLKRRNEKRTAHRQLLCHGMMSG